MSMSEGGEGAAMEGVESADTGLESHEGEGEGEGEASEGESPVEAALRKYKVRVAGEEHEVDEPTLLKDYELRQASHKRMEEAARLRREAEDREGQLRALLKQAKEDPRVFFKATGGDARAWAEKLLAEELENELLSPEERELRELRNLKKQRDEEMSRAEQERKKREVEALTQQAGAEIESELVDALKASGLKATPRTVARVAEIILASLDGEGPRLKATDVLPRVQKDYRDDVADHLESLEPETLEREYPSLYKKILEHSAKKKAPVPTFDRGIGKKQTSASRKPKSWDDWLKD